MTSSVNASMPLVFGGVGVEGANGGGGGEEAASPNSQAFSTANSLPSSGEEL